MLVNNETGIVQPLSAVAALVRERAPRAVLHTDAVQAPQWLDLREHTADADLVAISGHKFGGPKGVGALVVRGGVALGRSSKVAGTSRAGGRARRTSPASSRWRPRCRSPTRTAPTRRARIAALRDRLEAGLLDAVDGFRVTGDPHGRVAGVLHAAFPGVEAETLLVALDQRDVYAASGSACSSGAIDPSHVLLAMGMDATARCPAFASASATRRRPPMSTPRSWRSRPPSAAWWRVVPS